MRLLFLLAVLQCCTAYKMVIFTPDISKSQVMFNKRVAETLADAGHDVTMAMITSFDDVDNSAVKINANVKVYRVNASTGVSEKELHRTHSEVIFEDIPPWDKRQRVMMELFLGVLTESCRHTIRNKEFMHWLENEKFDIAFAHMYTTCPIGLIHAARIPTWVWLNSGMLMDFVADIVGVPTIPSYVPPGQMESHDRLDFFQRLKSFIGHGLLKVMWPPSLSFVAMLRKATNPQISAVMEDDFARSASPTAPYYNIFDSPLSTKRERRCTPVRAGRSAPRLARTAPNLSRFYPRRHALQKPHQISFKSVRPDDMHIRSPVYNQHLDMTYFEQCFTCERKLGEGSFGEVFAVFSKEDGRHYAVKRSLETFRNSSDRQLKLREVQKHELLPSHTNLVGFVKAWEERARLYIQTELCESSLSEYCSELHTVPETEIWNFLIDLLMAVHHLHKHDLLHLDIKPENILLTADKVCKLGDFGLVFDIKNDEKRTAEEGDSKYLAPEMLNGGPSKAADIFSLGITMLEISTDMDLPSRGEGWHQLRSGRIPERFFVSLSTDLRRLILWMTSPDPADRPSTNQLLKDAAIVSRKGHRTRQLHIHEMKSSITYHMYTVWMWVLAVVWLLGRVCSWTMEALKRTKNEVCHTPLKGSLFNGDRGIGQSAYPHHTPESSRPLFMDGKQDDDCSFSDEEGYPQPFHAHTVALARRRSMMNNSAFTDDPCPKYRLDFDDDTPTSSSDPNDESPTQITPPMLELQKSGRTPTVTSVRASPRSAIVHRSESRALDRGQRAGSVMSRGDWNHSPSLEDELEQDSDLDELVVEDYGGGARNQQGFLTCPARFPLRTQLRRRAAARPLPRLNFDLLDSPESEGGPPVKEKSPAPPGSAPPAKQERRRSRLADRMISTYDSSADD